MAEPTSDEGATLSTAAAGPSDLQGGAGVTSQADSATPAARPSRESATPSFQAVNSRADSEHGSITKPTLGGENKQSKSPTPSGKDNTPSQTDGKSAHALRNDDEDRESSAQPNGADVTMTDAPTYGTRSRNRTGNARPNYAEDQQDVEFESAATTVSYKKKQSADSSSAGQKATAVERRTQDSTRNVTPIDGLASAKDTGAGATNHKKRKTAGGSASTTQPFAASTATPPAHGAPYRKAGGVAATSAMTRETNVMSFRNHKSRLNKHGDLIADDGTRLRVNDHVYLVCEPPGDPYYLCRIMEFLHVESDNTASPVDAMRVNWYYRPRDVQRFNNDTRLVYATMHSDMCPLTSLRGKCDIKHRSEIDDLDEYRKQPNAFYFVQVFDRFIRRWYECIPTSQIINVPEKVKKALDERWKFVAVEIGRVKELTSAVKTCKRCAKYCASHDSVDCAICKSSYHMNCVQPPLPKKPSRGFAWACGPCGRAAERKMEAHHTPALSQANTDVEEEEIVEEEEVAEVSNDSTRAPSPDSDDIVIDDHPATQAEIKLAKMWPMRYLGIHCRVEDALQYDDRAIYPRASSRLGPRHQANVQVWHGQPVELVRPLEIKKKYVKTTTKKEGKLSKETVAAMEADRVEKAKRPKWVQDAPTGYVARGEDHPNGDTNNTAKQMFAMPDKEHKAVKASNLTPDEFVENYVKKAQALAKTVGVPPFGINFIDKVLEILTAADYDTNVALKKVSKLDRKHDLHEPVLSKDQLLKFEEGVAKYGSEHRLIRLHMKTNLPNSEIVRFYYLWKKTPKGREIWGSYGGRKGTKRKHENDAAARTQAEVAHDVDDSAFDNDKAIRAKRGFQCKFCNTRHARQWRRAPGVSPGQTILVDSKTGVKDKKDKVLLALCLRCAGLWRRYAIQWEDVDEMNKKISQAGGKAWKRKVDEELLRELAVANQAASMTPEPVMAVPSIEAISEPPKKKSKLETTHVPAVELPKKKEKPPPPPKEPTPPPPPIIPAQPQWRELPCAVCRTVGDTIACAHCKLTVHRRCFGLDEQDGIRTNGELYWICEQCQNDRDPQVSTDYSCALCLTEETQVDLVETPKSGHKKKTDREKEKERLEKELADGMRAEYKAKQSSMNRPVIPREPLKRTAGNNWVHVYCAVWTPEIKFSDAAKLDVAEGIQLIPPAKHEATCKLCKNKDHRNKVRTDKGSCVTCLQHNCGAMFHVSCAFEAGYQFGFDMTPVKNSRKDQIQTIQLGEETGLAVAAIWCKDHAVKTTVHPMSEIVDESGTTALQRYVENYKQADLTLTGTVRKANLAQQTKEKAQQGAPAAVGSDRRASTANGIAAAVRRGAKNSVSDIKSEDADASLLVSENTTSLAERRCAKCEIDVTPRWHFVEYTPPVAPPVRPPPNIPRMSTALGEIPSSNSQGSPQLARSISRTDFSGAPSTNPPVDQPSADTRPTDQMPMSGNNVPMTMARTAAEVNGETRQSIEGGNHGENDEGYHSHAMPHFVNPAAASSPKLRTADQLDWLCHKCFVNRKINPTPPPPSPLPRMETPPRRQYPAAVWPTNGQPPARPSYDPQQRQPWEESHRQQQAPPTVNGYGHPAPHQAFQPPGPPPPPPAQSYPPHYSQSNGYHGPPPPGGPLHAQGPPPLPEHGGGYHYQQPPQPSPHPRSYGPHTAPHHIPPPNIPPHTGYQPQPTPYPRPVPTPLNGITSPTAQHAPLQSPTFPPGHGRQPFAPFGRRTESPFTTTLPPIGGPMHSMQHENSASTSTPGQQDRGDQQQQPPPAGPNGAQTTPQPAPARPESQAGRPSTPREAQTTGSTPAPSGGGASASPSVRNLLS